MTALTPLAPLLLALVAITLVLKLIDYRREKGIEKGFRAVADELGLEYNKLGYGGFLAARPEYKSRDRPRTYAGLAPWVKRPTITGSLGGREVYVGTFVRFSQGIPTECTVIRMGYRKRAGGRATGRRLPPDAGISAAVTRQGVVAEIGRAVTDAVELAEIIKRLEDAVNGMEVQ